MHTADVAQLDDDTLAGLYPRYERPWLRVNFVSSLDGAVAVGGLSAGLSSPADKRVFKLLRMKCDALLVGAGTFRTERYLPLRLDETRRAWREHHGLTPYPRLVVLSATLALDPAHPALAGAIVLTTGDAAADPRLADVAEIIRCDDLVHGLALLHSRGLTQILSEGGPQVLGALGAADLVDELCLTLAPLLAGPGSGRITEGPPHKARRMTLAHALTAADGTVLLRHVRA